MILTLLLLSSSHNIVNPLTTIFIMRLIQRIATLPVIRTTAFLLSKAKPTPQQTLEMYDKVKEKEQKEWRAGKGENWVENYTHHRCDGCNSRLQTQDKLRFGFIEESVLERAVAHNAGVVEGWVQGSGRGDGKMALVGQVQRQLGVEILGQPGQKMKLDKVEVLLRLQDKIDQWEESQQVLRRTNANKKDILCLRCYSLKHHNRLPEDMDRVGEAVTGTEEEVMDRVLNKHKRHPVLYLFLVDPLDLLGTLTPIPLTTLLRQDNPLAIVISKQDIVNQRYLNQQQLISATRQAIQQCLHKHPQLQQKAAQVPIFCVSSRTRNGIESLGKHIDKAQIQHIQLVGMANTGKTTLLNRIGGAHRPTSSVPGTTIHPHPHRVSQRRIIFDMPGMTPTHTMARLIPSNNRRALLAWNKLYSPPVLPDRCLFYGGKAEMQGARIIPFGLGGSCASDNRWFLLNREEFWKGLPPPNQLQMMRHTVPLTFRGGKTDDVEIAGWGFMGFRVNPKTPTLTKTLTLHLPKDVGFRLRSTILSDDPIISTKSANTKRHQLHRIYKQPMVS